ncbi:hypothetical protein FACS1894164_20900 [Spirochaetia bacterium]|nr:hypothetical protein FACS1894164_20900 [Spirochaetia bacterium]
MTNEGLRLFYIIGKMLIFGFLIGLSVWMSNDNDRDLIPTKTKECFMKRFVAKIGLVVLILGMLSSCAALGLGL